MYFTEFVVDQGMEAKNSLLGIRVLIITIYFARKCNDDTCSFWQSGHNSSLTSLHYIQMMIEICIAVKRPTKIHSSGLDRANAYVLRQRT